MDDYHTKAKLLAIKCDGLRAENDRLRALLKFAQGTITQAMSCIRGETPEDCSFEEAEDDTYYKLRDADAQIDAALRHQQRPNRGMINITEDRLRWLVQERKHMTLYGAVEIAKGAPDLLKEIERLQSMLQGYRDEAANYKIENARLRAALQKGTEE